MAGVNAIGSATGVKAQNAEWFATDLSPVVIAPKVAKFRIIVSCSAAVVVDVTLDSGSNWTALNSGKVVGIDQLFTFDVPVRNGDTFNMRTPTAGGCTVDICRVDTVTGEG